MAGSRMQLPFLYADFAIWHGCQAVGSWQRTPAGAGAMPRGYAGQYVRRYITFQCFGTMQMVDRYHKCRHETKVGSFEGDSDHPDTMRLDMSLSMVFLVLI